MRRPSRRLAAAFLAAAMPLAIAQSGQALEKPGCSQPASEPATQPSKGAASGTEPGSSGSTGWSGAGLGGQHLVDRSAGQAAAAGQAFIYGSAQRHAFARTRRAAAPVQPRDAAAQRREQGGAVHRLAIGRGVVGWVAHGTASLCSRYVR